MTLTEYTNLLKTMNAQLRTATPVAQQPQQAAWLNEIQQRLTWLGANPSLYDYPQGTVLANALATSVPSSTFTLDRDFIAKPHLIRFVTTIGSTPTATFAVQGSKDNSTWANLLVADYLSPDTQVATSFTVTTATTNIKIAVPNQNFRYLRVNVTADTNVTYTIDITPL